MVVMAVQAFSPEACLVQGLGFKMSMIAVVVAGTVVLFMEWWLLRCLIYVLFSRLGRLTLLASLIDGSVA